MPDKPLERQEGWERRLDDAMLAAKNKPFQLGEHDCFRLACLSIEALTGVNLWTEFAGRYSGEWDKNRLIVEYGDGDFDLAISRIFGTEPQPVLHAQRGDIVSFQQQDGVTALGVCRGRYVSVTGEDGLLSVPLRTCTHVWRIG